MRRRRSSGGGAAATNDNQKPRPISKYIPGAAQRRRERASQPDMQSAVRRRSSFTEAGNYCPSKYSKSPSGGQNARRREAWLSHGPSAANKEMGGRCASRQRSVRILTNAQLQSGLQIIMYFKNPNLFRVRLREGDFRAVTTCAYAR